MKKLSFEIAVSIIVPAAVFLILFSARCPAVPVTDLVHDTPAEREKYRMDIIGFSTETAPVNILDESEQTAERLWLKRSEYQEFGQLEKADLQILALVDWRYDRGKSNLFSFAFLLIREAVKEAESGNVDRASALIDQAAMLAPDYPPVYTAGGYMAIRESLINLPQFFQGVLANFKARHRNARHFIVFLSRISLAATLVIVLTVFVWSVSMVTRYAHHLKHDLDEAGGGRRHSAPGRRLKVIVAVTAVVLLLISPLWLAALAIFATWSYQGIKEKIFSLAGTMFLCLLPLTMWTTSSIAIFLGNDLNQALMDFRNGSETPAQAAILKKAHDSDPGDTGLTFSLAQHFWREGDYEASEELFRKVLDSDDPLRVESTVNIGNIMMARGDLDGAAEMFRKAIGMNPDSVTAHYNLGQVLNLQFSFKEGQEELKKAMSLDKRLISGRSSVSEGNVYRTMLNENIPLSLLTGRVFDSEKLRALRTGGPDLWKMSMTGVPAVYFPAMIVLITLCGLIYSHTLNRRGLTHRCARCGRPFCPMCVHGGAKSDVCPQCRHIFVVKEGVESAMRVEKMIEIQLYHRWRRRIGFLLSALLPGGGQIYYGSPLLGTILAALTSILLVFYMGWHRYIVDSSMLVFPWDGFYRALLLSFIIVVYIVNLLTVYLAGKKER